MENITNAEARKLAVDIMEEIPMDGVVQFLNDNTEIIFEMKEGSINLLPMYGDDNDEVKHLAEIARDL